MSKIEITDVDLIEQIQSAIAKAEAAAASANAAAANASSAQSSTGAAGGTTNARTQANTESDTGYKADVSQTYKNIDSDVNIVEAWSVNAKRTYDFHQTYDMESQTQNRTHFNTLITQLQTHLANVNQLTLQSLANNQNQSNLCNTLSIDRSWNINETDLAAKAAAILTDKVLAAATKE